jgi:N6-adenosine-specific RNA methylase IME4
MTENVQLVNYDAARSALQKAHRVDEVKSIRDKAEALRVYAKQAGDTEMQNWLVEIKVRATRRLGVVEKEQRDKGEIAKSGRKGEPAKNRSKSGDVTSLAPKPTLKDLGIDSHLSATAAKFAASPEVKFDQIIAETKEKSKELTSAAILRVAVQAPARAAKQEKIAREAKAGGQALPTGTLFPVVLCDCPWKYDFASTESRAIENQYPTASVQELCLGIFNGRDVRTLFAKDAAMFFWATAPKLREALQVLDAWGFEYKTNFVWDKEKIGMGYWCRGQHEHLLVATRGDMPAPDASARVSSVIRADRDAHSEKPKVVFSIIKKMFPKLPKLQLFGREQEAGWVTWGNQLQ